MSLRISTDIQGLAAHLDMQVNDRRLSRSMDRISSGLRINRSADDAAGMGLSEKMRAQIRGLQQAQRNAQDAVSLVQAADGMLESAHSILQRVRELAVQYNNTVLDATQRATIQAEVASLSAELSRLDTSGKFMGITLFAGGPTMTFQVGSNSNEIVTLQSVSIASASAAAVAPWGASANLAALDAAISSLADVRSTFGAVQNRLEGSLNQLAAFEGNLQASESSVRDVDVAAEMTQLTQLQIMRDANLAMLAQGNVPASSLLRLLE